MIPGSVRRPAEPRRRAAATGRQTQPVLTAGTGNLVDADLAKKAASLEAARVKEQLALQSLSIVNRALE